MSIKIVVVTRVKNEIDIIESFVRHHAELCHSIIILDDGSTDGTYEILLKMQSDRFPITVFREPTIGYDQSIFLTNLVKKAIDKFDADWIFPLDADEFLELSSDLSLEAVLADWGPRLMHLGWTNFVWRRELADSVERNPVLRLRNRLPPRSDHTKIAIPAAAILARNYVVSVGSHFLLIDGCVQSADTCRDLNLCHFPIRDINQFATKVVVSYLQFRSWKGDGPGTAIQLDAPFEALKGGIPEFIDAMEATSIRYSVPQNLEVSTDYIDRSFKYLGGPISATEKQKPFLTNLLRHTEAMAAKIKDASEKLFSIQSTLNNLMPDLDLDDITKQIESFKVLVLSLRKKNESKQTTCDLLVSQNASTVFDFEQKILTLNQTVSVLEEQVCLLHKKSLEENLLLTEARNAMAAEAAKRIAAEHALDETMERLHELAIAYSRSESARAALRQTLSWRITAPLRLIKFRFNLRRTKS